LVNFIFSEFAEVQKVVERTAVHAMEPVLVTVEEMEVVAGGQVGPSASEAISLVGILPLSDAVIEKALFDGPEAANTPDGGDHFLDRFVLDVVGGREPGQVLSEELCETLLGFIVQDDGFR